MPFLILSKQECLGFFTRHLEQHCRARITLSVRGEKEMVPPWIFPHHDAQGFSMCFSCNVYNYGIPGHPHAESDKMLLWI